MPFFSVFYYIRKNQLKYVNIVLTIARHKLYAPKGIGALYLKKGINIKDINLWGKSVNSFIFY